MLADIHFVNLKLFIITFHAFIGQGLRMPAFSFYELKAAVEHVLVNAGAGTKVKHPCDLLSPR